jgi:hypothetical protein
VNLRATNVPYAPWMAPGAWRSTRRAQNFIDRRNWLGAQNDSELYSLVTPAVTLAPGAAAVFNLYVEGNAVFELLNITSNMLYTVLDVDGKFAAAVLLQIFDHGTGHNLFQRPIPVGVISGTGQLSHLMPVPRRFLPRTTITVTMTNIDTATTQTNVQLCLNGRKIYEDDASPRPYTTWRGDDRKLYAEEYYGYVLYTPLIAPAAVQEVAVLTEGDSDFEWLQASVMSFGAAQTPDMVSTYPLNWLLTDGGSQRDLMDPAENTLNNLGSGSVPMVNATPHVFFAQSRIKAILTNVYTTNITDWYALLEGRKIFEVPE